MSLALRPAALSLLSRRQLPVQLVNYAQLLMVEGYRLAPSLDQTV